MKKVIDYLGNEFRSVKEMCNAYGIDYAKYISTAKRIKASKTKTKKKRGKPRGMGRKKITLSDGRTFNSIHEAAELFGISYGTVMERVHKRKWDLEKALTTPKYTVLSIPCTDGVNQYNSLAEMARALGVSKDRIYQRYHRGKEITKDTIFPKDHLGNVYPSKSAMYKAYGVTASQFSARLSQGHTLEEALTGVYDTRFTCFDHLGNKFKSEREMCKAHHISFNTYRARKKKGYMLEQCLSRKLDWREHCFDHLGIEYPSIKEMCKTYKVNMSTFENRIKKGMTLKEALTKKGA